MEQQKSKAGADWRCLETLQATPLTTAAVIIKQMKVHGSSADFSQDVGGRGHAG